MEIEWINVNERLPEKMTGVNISKHVLCACENHPTEGGHFQRTLYFDHVLLTWNISYNEPVKWIVTHWMPLPSPPSNT